MQLIRDTSVSLVSALSYGAHKVLWRVAIESHQLAFAHWNLYRVIEGQGARGLELPQFTRGLCKTGFTCTRGRSAPLARGPLALMRQSNSYTLLHGTHRTALYRRCSHDQGSRKG